MGMFDRLAGKPTAAQIEYAEKDRVAHSAAAQAQGQSAAYVTTMQEVDKLKAQNPNAQPHELQALLIRNPKVQAALKNFPAEEIPKRLQEAIAALQAPKSVGALQNAPAGGLPHQGRQQHSC